LTFEVDTLPLGPAYFRVFKYGGYYYSIVRGGLLLRSPEPHAAFEEGPTLIKPDEGRILRHAAVDLRGDLLRKSPTTLHIVFGNCEILLFFGKDDGCTSCIP
jgi:hypothetical protein